MIISKKYSHLNGEEYLIVHHKALYDEIKNIGSSIKSMGNRTNINTAECKSSFLCLFHSNPSTFK